MRVVPTADDLQDFWLETDVSVTVLPSRKPTGPPINLALVVHSDKYDLCVITHGPKALGDAVLQDGE